MGADPLTLPESAANSHSKGEYPKAMAKRRQPSDQTAGQSERGTEERVRLLHLDLPQTSWDMVRTTALHQGGRGWALLPSTRASMTASDLTSKSSGCDRQDRGEEEGRVKRQ